MSQLFKRFVKEKVLPLMKQHNRIRNCTIIAHIDHGKTTLSDSLLAASGLISRKLAAELRYLDYDYIEQTRGITIKAASVCLSYSIGSTKYLINLIDTPGHIDFSGYVSRSLRVSDGAIVVVDAVEGIMVQTETVTRQALTEYVKPVLFINKVDRLVKEKKLDKKSLLLALNNLIQDFNNLIEKYKPADYNEDLTVSFKKGNVAFGSAKHKWGVNVYSLLEWVGHQGDPPNAKQLLEYLSKFLDYVYSVYSHDDVDYIEKELSEKFPVERSVLEMVIKHIPDPATAQKLRIKHLWPGDTTTSIGQAMLNCNIDGPISLFIYDVQLDPHAGLIAFGRLFSGSVKYKQELVILGSQETFKIQNLYIFMGKSKIPVREIPAGNMVAITGMKKIVPGETVVSPQYHNIKPFEELRYVSEPVVTYVVEPVSLRDLERTKETIMLYTLTDPNLRFYEDKETGEMLLSGMGELHIEITVEKLKRLGVELEIGRPRVNYHETIIGPSDVITATSSDGTLSLSYQLFPILLENTSVSSSMIDSELVLSELSEKFKLPLLHSEHVVFLDSRRMNCIINTSQVDISAFQKDLVAAFKNALNTGPLAYEACSNIAMVLHNVNVGTAPQNISLLQLSDIFLKLHQVMLSVGMTLLEPWQRLEITVPERFVGKVVDIINKRRGKVIEISKSKYLYKIVSELPLRNTFGFSAEIRSETRGYSTWGAKFIGYKKVPDKEFKQLVITLRREKGLPEDLPI